MSKGFQEEYKVDIALFDATGSTTEQVSRYYDMQGYSRADFLVAGKEVLQQDKATFIQSYAIRLLQASNATGGGATAIAASTVTMGKTAVGVTVTSTYRANELFLTFSTMTAGATVSILGQKFTAATANSAAYYFAGLSSDVSTIAMTGFVAAFNATNNTLSSVWEAASHVHAAAATVGMVRIYKKDQAATGYITCTGSTLINPGIGKCLAHVGIDAQHMQDSKRYIAIGCKSTADPKPVSITLVRKVAADAPASKEAIQVSKSVNTATSL